MKEEVSFKINEYNHRLSTKIDEFVLLSSFKKDQQQVLYQPFPIYLPPMYPQMPPPMIQSMPPYMPDDDDYDAPSQYQRYQNNMYPNQYPRLAPKRTKKPLKIVSKNKLLKFRKAVFAALFTIRLQKFT